MNRHHTRVVRTLAVVRHRVIYHIKYHRLEWFAGIGISCFCFGWFAHSEGFKHFAEFTGVPVLEAFLTRGEE